jgi:hypothetical protein
MLKGLIASLVIAVSISVAEAQDLIVAAPDIMHLTTAQNEQLKLLRSLPTSESVKVIKVDPEQLRDNPDVSIALTDDSTLSFSRTGADPAKDTQFVWTGETQTGLAMGGGPEGDATVSVNGDQVSAIIRTSDGVFRIQPLPGGLHAIIKVDISGLPSEHPPEGATPRNEQRDVNERDLRGESDDSVAKIDVLVLFTPDAARLVSDPVLAATSVVEEASKSLSGSGIRADLHLASTNVVQYQESGSQDTDLDRLVAPDDGYLDEAQALRDQFSADLVVLLSNDSQYCGLAKEIFASPQNAFATVYWVCAMTNLSLAHEIGHLLGACHNPEVNADCAPFAYGHGYTIPSEGVRTIMAYQCPQGNCTRVPQWSRPPAWGTAATNNDARVLDQTSLRASHFR